MDPKGTESQKEEPVHKKEEHHEHHHKEEEHEHHHKKEEHHHPHHDDRHEHHEHHEPKKLITQLTDLPESQSVFVPASKVEAKLKKPEEEERKIPASESQPLTGSADLAYSERSKEFLTKLNQKNLPVRAGLKEDDPFSHCTKREFFLTFLAAWALIWFVTSLVF